MDFDIERERLKTEIEKSLNRELYMRESILLCNHTPDILIKVGLDDKPILFTQRHLRDGLHPKGKNPKWHGLQIEDYLDLAKNISEPAMIIDSFSDDDSILVITDTVDLDKNPIMACLKTNGTGQYQISTTSSNYLTSVYGRENFENFLIKNLEADFVLYSNKEKIQNLERFCELPLLADYPADFEFNIIIHKSNNIVNNDFSVTLRESENIKIRRIHSLIEKLSTNEIDRLFACSKTYGTQVQNIHDVDDLKEKYNLSNRELTILISQCWLKTKLEKTQVEIDTEIDI